ncbi:MAG: xanthine dehydrogenase family protein [Planctomycetes bacterium]|nr:xanthine dehydrogenase family protein [Planctomycetota bacterium]
MRRFEGLSKLSGAERYVDDHPADDVWWGMTVRSPAPRGRIRRITFGDGVDWSSIVVVDHRDIPGPNEVRFIELDQPVLAADEVRHVHEPVLLLAHPSREVARRAAAVVTVEIDEAEPALEYRDHPRPEQIQHGPDNVLASVRIDKGDVESALASAAHVIEGVYETGAQEHVYLETNGMEAWLDGDVLTVHGSMQCPYYVLNALVHALDRDSSSVRVIQTPTGGGFGGKEDFPSILALHAALLALASERRVRMIYDRGEDMVATTKRHPARVRHRTGVDDAGRLVAQDIDVLMDGGAYVTLSPVVLSRGIIHAAGPYSCEHVRVVGRTMLTNAVPYGAFRGFGAPQTQFACERHMDVIARRLGMDPVALRRVNLIRNGQATCTGQTIDDGVDREDVLDTALGQSRYEQKRRAHATFNASSRWLRRGIGLATFYHGAGFTGSGEVTLKSVQRVVGLPDGRVQVLSANTEIGQGTTTILTQIAAARLGVTEDRVIVAVPDTSRVPNSGPTVASRTAMVVGRLVERACDDLRRCVGADGTADGSEVAAAIREWYRAHPGETPVGEAVYEPPPGVQWDEVNYRGDAYGAFAWATYVAEVEVDLRTYTARVIDFTAVQEIGTVLNETLARGQVAGGVVQAIGWALTEECIFERGAMVNGQLTNYAIPTSDDVPPIRVAFLEHPYEHGAQGAKGIGELSMDGPAPAIANAIADAIAVAPNVIPVTPERLMELVNRGAA